MTTPATTTAPKKTSIFEDFIDVFVSPSQLFARRQNGGFFLPLVILTVLMVVLYLGTKPLLQPIFDAEFARQTAAAIKANPQTGAAQMAAARKFADIIILVGLVIGFPIFVLITGVVLWIVGKLVSATQTLGAAMVVATFAFFPQILNSVVQALQAAVMDPAQLTSKFSVSVGLARFMDPNTSSKLVLAVASHVDVFFIWSIVLLAIGLAVTGKISKQRAAIAGVILWVLSLLPGVVGALWTARMGMG